jgi:hypothetical protein
VVACLIGLVYVTMIGANGTPVGPTLREPGANDITISLPASAARGGRIRSDGGLRGIDR